MAKGLQGLFLALRHAAAATLLLLPACSDVALPSEDMPACGPDPGYNNLVAIAVLLNCRAQGALIRSSFPYSRPNSQVGSRLE